MVPRASGLEGCLTTLIEKTEIRNDWLDKKSQEPVIVDEVPLPTNEDHQKRP
jgi:hypothetical protein